jgi:hypothetical protein
MLAEPVIWFFALWTIGIAASMAGGALAGYAIGGRDLGAELATQLGGLFGVLSGIPGVALALLLVIWLG